MRNCVIDIIAVMLVRVLRTAKDDESTLARAEVPAPSFHPSHVNAMAAARHP